jgi:hypothetical protein
MREARRWRAHAGNNVSLLGLQLGLQMTRKPASSDFF